MGKMTVAEMDYHIAVVDEIIASFKHQYDRDAAICNMRDEFEDCSFIEVDDG